MILIVGLGNPGKKYKNTRHNLGFQVIDALRKEVSEGFINGKKVTLAKPQTFMNESGKVVKKLIGPISPIRPIGLIVIHDDIDLPLGIVKLVKNRGSAGHKGVQSIIDALGTKDFHRVRIGIKPAKSFAFRRAGIDKFVLQQFTKTENKVIKESIKKATEAIELAIKQEDW